jgi:hypothetical protein
MWRLIVQHQNRIGAAIFFTDDGMEDPGAYEIHSDEEIVLQLQTDN